MFLLLNGTWHVCGKCGIQAEKQNARQAQVRRSDAATAASRPKQYYTCTEVASKSLRESPSLLRWRVPCPGHALGMSPTWVHTGRNSHSMCAMQYLCSYAARSSADLLLASYCLVVADAPAPPAPLHFQHLPGLRALEDAGFSMPCQVTFEPLRSIDSFANLCLSASMVRNMVLTRPPAKQSSRTAERSVQAIGLNICRASTAGSHSIVALFHNGRCMSQ